MEYYSNNVLVGKMSDNAVYIIVHYNVQHITALVKETGHIIGLHLPT